MKDPRQIHVFGPGGELGWLAIQDETADPAFRMMQLSDGTILEVPADYFIEKEDGSYYLPVDPQQINQDLGRPENDEAVIPVIHEQVNVTKKPLSRVVRIHKQVDSHPVVVDEPGYLEEVDVTRVALNQPVDKAPEMHYEGDTLIIPVMAEVLVVEKRLVLKEEIHITRRQKDFHNPKKLTLREETVTVERQSSPDTASRQDKKG